MPWKGSVMSQREEFVRQALEEGANMSQLCREYRISRKTGYKWKNRYLASGTAGLQDRSRRPQHSPTQTRDKVEQVVLFARDKHPAWGGRKLKRWLEDRGYQNIPAPSTVTEILRRNGRLDPLESAKREAYQCFEREEPNQLWQMDFKGHFELSNGQRCHPLTVLDDHSRFLLGLRACSNETTETVQQELTGIFKAYGVPDQMIMDNGSPWGDDAETTDTVLTVWLYRVGVRVSHSKPYHPQTLGKDERLHRSLKAEVLAGHSFEDLSTSQVEFDHWQQLYNFERPHEALDLAVPATRYQPSPRPFPDRLPPLRFPEGAAIRKVDAAGKISFLAHSLRVGKAFRGQAVGVLSDPLKGDRVHVFFNDLLVRSFDLTLEC